jgi:hypothetical protein
MVTLKAKMRLTEHFHLYEFLRSKEYPGLAKKLDPSPVHINNLYFLCATVLEPARQNLGRPIHITSGFRNEELNKAVGGSRKSLHMFGKAADFTVANTEHLFKAYEFIRDELPYSYSYLKYDGTKKFIHVGLPHPGREQREEIAG